MNVIFHVPLRHPLSFWNVMASQLGTAENSLTFPIDSCLNAWTGAFVQRVPRLLRYEWHRNRSRHSRELRIRISSRRSHTNKDSIREKRGKDCTYYLGIPISDLFSSAFCDTNHPIFGILVFQRFR